MYNPSDPSNPISVFPGHYPLFQAIRYCEHDLPYLKFEKTDEAEELIILGADEWKQNRFICIPKSQLQSFYNVDDEIQETGMHSMESRPAYRPLLTEMCIAKVVSTWYRCKLVGRNDAGIEMYAVDYGCIITVAEENIRVSNCTSALNLLDLAAMRALVQAQMFVLVFII